MVRTTQAENRLRLTQLLMDADQPCRRLFLDYQGLRILSHWMQVSDFSSVPDPHHFGKPYLEFES
jgi:hypothetical protein